MPTTTFHLSLLLRLILLTSSLLLHFTSATPSFPDRFLLHHSPAATFFSDPQEYLDPTYPPPLLPSKPPTFSLLLFSHAFAYTYGVPPISVPYSPPTIQWSRAVLELSANCAGEQYDRIAAVWLGGAELLRTSTAEPTPDGVYWRVRKDVTRYSALLRRPPDGGVLSVMLENIVNDVFTGIYHVNVSLHLYSDSDEFQRGLESGLGSRSEQSYSWVGDEERSRIISKLGLGLPLDQSSRVPLMHEKGQSNFWFLPQGSTGLSSRGIEFSFDKRKLEKSGLRFDKRLGFSSTEAGNLSGRSTNTPLYQDAADLIIPISSENSENGFWFRVKNSFDVYSKSVEVPLNTYRAVLEIYVSFHSNDEFWYSNPPDSYIKMNNLTTGRGNGAFREVFATIDGRFVGSIIPFPVIFTGGVNPLFWQPVVAIGAFNLPSYDINLNPFLDILLDGKPHEFGLKVTDGISFWLVDANLHLWLDSNSDSVQAKLVHYRDSSLRINRLSESHHLNGTFIIKAERKFHFAGWVSSYLGNLTTDVEQKLKFKSLVEFRADGNYKEVWMKAKTKTDVKIKNGSGVVLFRDLYKTRYPLHIITSTVPEENDTSTMSTNLTHTLHQRKTTFALNELATASILTDRQEAYGWMHVQDHSVLAGSAQTVQTYRYQENSDCYMRKLKAKDGQLQYDNSTNSCAFPW